MRLIFSDGITLKVHPSNIVEVNQMVTLQCSLNPNPTPPVVVKFAGVLGNIICTLEPNNGVCKDTTDFCLSRYNASCSNEIVFSIQVNVPSIWNGISIYCSTFYSKSNNVNFNVTGMWKIIVLKTEILILAIKFLIHFLRFYRHKCMYVLIMMYFKIIMNNQNFKK